MATLEKTRGYMMHAEATGANDRRALSSAASNYRRDQPRILTEDFAQELALANRQQRAQRCPWLERNLARLSQLDLGTAGLPSATAQRRKDQSTMRPAK